MFMVALSAIATETNEQTKLETYQIPIDRRMYKYIAHSCLKMLVKYT